MWENGQVAMTPEKRLWQEVVLLALIDALKVEVRRHRDGNASTSRLDQSAARSWIVGGGRDYRACCSLAGIDGDMLRDRYLAGQINADVLIGKVRGGRAFHKSAADQGAAA